MGVVQSVIVCFYVENFMGLLFIQVDEDVLGFYIVDVIEEVKVVGVVNILVLLDKL